MTVVRVAAARTVPLLLGLLALVLGTAAGGDAGLLHAIVAPPVLVRAVLVAVAVVVGLWLLARALDRIRAAGPIAGAADRVDVAAMLRGIRLVFLALAALAAAAGWLFAQALPLLIATVIAGIDVVETSFLLLVLAVRPAASGRARGDP